MRGAWREAVAWLPDLLSASRVALGGVVWWVRERPRWVLAIAALAAVTDVLDGAIARRLRSGAGEGGGARGGERGAWLDPLCDKLFVASWLAAVASVARPSPLFVAAVVARELLLGALLLSVGPRWWRAAVGRGSGAKTNGVCGAAQIDWRASAAGKATTVLQFAAIGALAGGRSSLAWGAACAAAVVGGAAAVGYAGRWAGRRGAMGRA